ncbi:MAG: hypothetical protein NTX32_05655 [Candidatus Firestonebacteria bacterium]|nr:hypothetical protein [Candidatus Firestonebacteria bacterium]
MPEHFQTERSALIIKPLAPYWEWANSIEDGIPPEQKGFNGTEKDHTVYLIPVSSPEMMEKHVKELFPKIFEEELKAWWTNENDWPKNRTYKMFKKWFEVSFAHAVYDKVEQSAEIKN